VDILESFRLGNSIRFSDVFSASHLTPRTVAFVVVFSDVMSSTQLSISPPTKPLSDSPPTQPAFGWRSLTLFRHQTRANLDVALLVPWGKLAAILGSRGLVVGQDSLPFFGRETLTAFRQHDRIEDSQPKNGSRFLTEKRRQIRYRKTASFAAGRSNRIPKSWQRFAAQRLNISNQNLAEAGRDTIHLTLIWCRVRCGNITSPTEQSKYERTSRSHPMSTVRGVRWQAKNTSKKRMEFPNRKLAEVRREMLNTEFKIRASSRLTI